MKRKFKKAVAVILTAAMTMSVGVPAFAMGEDAEVQLLSADAVMVQNMSDEDFDQFMIDYIFDENNAEKSTSELQEDLALLGVEYIPLENTSSTYALTSSKIKLSSYATKRVTDDYYRLTGSVYFTAKETTPSIEDLLTVEWRTDQATYDYNYNYNEYVNVREMDTASGIVTFNVDDAVMNANDIAYGVVYVVPKASASQINFASSFIHTYDSTQYSWSGTLNLGYSDAVNGNVSITLNATTIGHSVPVYEENIVYL